MVKRLSRRLASAAVIAVAVTGASAVRADDDSLKSQPNAFIVNKLVSDQKNIADFQDPVLRKRFTGTPEHVINFFFFIAEEVRELMAKLGFRTFNEMVGQVGKLDPRKAVEHWKAHGVDLSRILYQPELKPGMGIHHSETQNHHLDKALDQFRLDVGRYPSTEEGLQALVAGPSGEQRWAGPYLKKGVPADPWGHPYVYEQPSTHGGDFDLFTYGKDGRLGGNGEDADIGNW